MAIKRIEIYTCDKCGSECRPQDNYRTAKYDYYHDVGYSRVRVSFNWSVPYAASDGHLCPSCVDDAILKLAAEISETKSEGGK